MERGVTYRSLIEYFLLMQNDGGDNTKLVYYDQQGTRFEKPIERGHIDHALKKFDGKPKAVTRSSGGLVRAVPYQLVLCDEPRGGLGEVTPRPKIKVKFRDFTRDAQGRVLGNSFQTVSKLVEPEEVMDLFGYRLDEPQRFVLDVGRGIVPIYIFRYGLDRSGKFVALFVELDDIERAMLKRAEGSPITIQAHQVPRDLVRYARPHNSYGRDELDMAMENYRIQKESGLAVLPESLRCGTAIQVPSNLTYLGFRRLVGNEIRKMVAGRITVDTTTFVGQPDMADEEEPLVPFGKFEAR